MKPYELEEQFERRALEFDGCCVAACEAVFVAPLDRKVRRASSMGRGESQDLRSRVLNFLMKCKICRLLASSVSGMILDVLNS